MWKAPHTAGRGSRSRTVLTALLKAWQGFDVSDRAVCSARSKAYATSSFTGEIGLIKITSESSVAAGVRRIEAVTGKGAQRYVEFLEKERHELARFLKVQPTELAGRIHKLVDEVKRLDKKVKTARTEQAGSTVGDMVARAVSVKGVKVVSERLDNMDQSAMRDLADRVKDKLRSGVVVLGSDVDGKAALVVMVSKDLTDRVRAGDIMKKLATMVGGKGGGRPDMAQGGGPDVAKLDAALKSVQKLVKG